MDWQELLGLIIVLAGFFTLINFNINKRLDDFQASIKESIKTQFEALNKRFDDFQASNKELLNARLKPIEESNKELKEAVTNHLPTLIKKNHEDLQKLQTEVKEINKKLEKKDKK